MLDLLVLAIAPAIFLLLFIYAKDRYEPEPLHLVLWIFFLGCLSVIPAAVIEGFFPDGTVTSSVVAPVVEESLKFLVVFIFIWRKPEFSEPVDGIVYAAAASLGFAMIENIFYVLDGGVAVGILRALLSVPGHVIFSCIWGAALGIAKFRPGHHQGGIITGGLCGAILLHGLFNFSIEALDAGGVLLILILVPAGLWWTCRNIRCAHADPASACSAYAGMNMPLPDTPKKPAGTLPDNPAALTHRTDFCTACGAALDPGERFCRQCGKER